jgi:hypothetical protein
MMSVAKVKLEQNKLTAEPPCTCGACIEKWGAQERVRRQAVIVDESGEELIDLLIRLAFIDPCVDIGHTSVCACCDNDCDFDEHAPDCIWVSARALLGIR